MMKAFSSIFFSICLWLVSFLGFSNFAGAAENSFIQAVQERGVLTVGIPGFDSPPAYGVSEESGELEGYDIEVARGLAKKLNVGVQFDRSSANLNDLVRRVATGDFDIAIGKLGRTYQRLFDAFPVHYLDFRHALLANRTFLSELPDEPGTPGFSKVLEQSAIKIGSLQGSIWKQETADNFPNASFVGYKNWSDAQRALFDGRVDAIYRDMTEIKSLVYARPDLIIDYVPIIFDDIVDQKSIYLSRDGAVDFSPFIQFYISKEWGGVKTDVAILDEFKSFYSAS